jgi:hypothetical protein
MADRTLVVKLVGDEADLIRSYGKAEKATKSFGRTTDSSLAKTDKRLRGLKTAGAGFAGGFITSEVLNNLSTFIDKASESEKVLTQVRQGMKVTGQSWETYGEQIEKTVRAQSKLGFDDEELLAGFDRFNRLTGDSTQALKLNNLAMDVARGRNISLEAAQTLVTKAAAGQRGALTRLGIQVDKGADKTELLRKLTEKYGGSAKAAGDDAATAQDRLAVSVENVQEAIGTLLLPTVGELADNLSEAADAASNIIGELDALSKAKIPVIDIPINFEIPGTDKKIFDLITSGLKTGIKAQTIGVPLTLIGLGGDVIGSGRGGGSRAGVRRGPGGGPIRVDNNVSVEIDGEAVTRPVTKQQQKQTRRNPRQKRGPNSAFR